MTFSDLLKLMRRGIVPLIIVPVAAALLTGVFSFLFLPNVYTASSSVYVLARVDESTSTSALSTSLSASQMLTNDVASLITNERVCDDVAQELGMRDLSDYAISVANSTSNRIITLYVTGKNPATARDVANGLAADVSVVAQEVMNVESVNVINRAQTPSYPSGPNRGLYVIAAFVAAFLLTVAGIVLMDALDTRVRDSAEVERLLGVPIIGQFPTVKEVR